MSCILAADLTQYDPIFCKFFDISAFLRMRYVDRTVAHLHIADAKFPANRDIIFKLIADEKSFEQCSAKINRDIKRIRRQSFLSDLGLRKMYQNRILRYQRGDV